MKSENIDITMMDIYEHPHAEIVRECVAEFVRIVLAKSPLGILREYEKDPPGKIGFPRDRMAVRFMAGEDKLDPTYIKLERRGHLNKCRPDLRRYFKNAYTSTVNALPFFRECGYETYSYGNMETAVKPFDFLPCLINLFKELEPYCAFSVSYNKTNPGSGKYGNLLISICLTEEFEARHNFDFIAQLRIDSAKEAHRRRLERIAKKALEETV